jgi:hypothetical protein
MVPDPFSRARVELFLIGSKRSAIQRALVELNRRNEGTSKPALAARIVIDSGPLVVMRPA